MYIDVSRPESWEELNDQVKAMLGLESRLRTRSFYGLSQAVFEISQSAAQFMSHKKAIGVIIGQTAVFESLLPYYYKETYEVQTILHSDLTNIQEWVDGLKKDTNFVLYSEDHPVTGELYPFADQLDQLLNQKRISSFRISHSHHFHEGIEIRPYTTRICSYNPTAAIAILGERFRAPALMVQNMNWNSSQFLQEMKSAYQGREVNPLLIEKIENDLSEIAQPFFKPGASRIFDRAVCIFPDVSAEALAQLVFKKMGITSEEGWTKMSTTNMCHWSAVRMFRHWWVPQPTQEQLRGMLIIGPELISTKDFAKFIISSYEEIKAQQSWEL